MASLSRGPAEGVDADARTAGSAPDAEGDAVELGVGVGGWTIEGDDGVSSGGEETLVQPLNAITHAHPRARSCERHSRRRLPCGDGSRSQHVPALMSRPPQDQRSTMVTVSYTHLTLPTSDLV